MFKICMSTPGPIIFGCRRPFLPTPANRLKDAIAELRKALAAYPALPLARKENNKPPGRIQITVDVLELGPIELEVGWRLPASVFRLLVWCVHAGTGRGGSGRGGAGLGWTCGGCGFRIAWPDSDCVLFA